MSGSSLYVSRRRLKDLWAESALRSASSLEKAKEELSQFAGKARDPLSLVLVYLAAREMGQSRAPLELRVDLLPLHELCQLALLWDLAGELDAASSLGATLPIEFPWLWCKESEYNEKEATFSIQALSSALGKGELKDLHPKIPFLSALHRIKSHFKAPPSASLTQLLTWRPFQAEGIKGALTFCGSGTSLGAMIAKTVEIRAFGPQKPPLSDSKGFGIRSTFSEKWASAAAQPHIWFDTELAPIKGGISLNLSFFGLKISEPLTFCFYVKADTAKMGTETIAPGTLHRYRGVAQPIVFGGNLRLEASCGIEKMEVIPLAGRGGFWDCEYLTAFEIHPLNPKVSFSLLLL